MRDYKFVRNYKQGKALGKLSRHLKSFQLLCNESKFNNQLFQMMPKEPALPGTGAAVTEKERPTPSRSLLSVSVA